MEELITHVQQLANAPKRTKPDPDKLLRVAAILRLVYKTNKDIYSTLTRA